MGKKQSKTLQKRFFKWLNNSKRIHGKKYNYSCTDYVNMKTKVRIKCPIHGCFYIFPSSHASGVGCPSCRKFIKRISFKRGNRYFLGKYRKNRKQSVIKKIKSLEHTSMKIRVPQCLEDFNVNEDVEVF